MRKLFIRSMLLSLFFAPEAAEIEGNNKRNKGRARQAANIAQANTIPPPVSADINNAIDARLLEQEAGNKA